MRHAGMVCGNRPSQFGTRLVQDRCDTIRDQVGCFEVDFIDLFFRELGLAGVDVLQRHQEDHCGTGFFIGPVEETFPGIRTKAHRAGEAVHPRFP